MSLLEKLIDIFYKLATSGRSVRTLLTPVGAIFIFAAVFRYFLQKDSIQELVEHTGDKKVLNWLKGNNSR